VVGRWAESNNDYGLPKLLTYLQIGVVGSFRRHTTSCISSSTKPFITPIARIARRGRRGSRPQPPVHEARCSMAAA